MKLKKKTRKKKGYNHHNKLLLDKFDWILQISYLYDDTFDENIYCCKFKWKFDILLLPVDKFSAFNQINLITFKKNIMKFIIWIYRFHKGLQNGHLYEIQINCNQLNGSIYYIFIFVLHV